MSSFAGLIKNEFIKIIKKKSTVVMIIIVLVSAILSPLVMIKVKEFVDQQFYYGEASIEEYKNSIDFYKSSKPSNWELQVEKNQYCIDNEVLEDWRIDAAEKLFQIKTMINNTEKDINDYDFDDEMSFIPGDAVIAAGKEIADKIDKSIVDSNYKDYYGLILESVNVFGSLLEVSEREIEMLKYECDWRIKKDCPYDRKNELSNIITNAAIAKYIQSDEGDGGMLKLFPANSGASLQDSGDNALIYEYMLENNVYINVGYSCIDISNAAIMYELTSIPTINMWTGFNFGLLSITILGMMVLVLAGASIAGEFADGTIKFLLINPVKRWKIFVSKYVTVILIGGIMLLLLYIISGFTSAAMMGFKGMDAPYLYVKDNAVREISGFLYMAKNMLLQSVNVVIMATLAFAVSSLMRNTSFAVGISMFAMLGGNVINGIFKILNIDWGRFLIFANSDLNAVVNGNSGYLGHTVSFALVVIAVHMVILWLIAWDGFVRREV